MRSAGSREATPEGRRTEGSRGGEASPGRSQVPLDAVVERIARTAEAQGRDPAHAVGAVLLEAVRRRTTAAVRAAREAHARQTEAGARLDRRRETVERSWESERHLCSDERQTLLDACDEAEARFFRARSACGEAMAEARRWMRLFEHTVLTWKEELDYWPEGLPLSEEERTVQASGEVWDQGTCEEWRELLQAPVPALPPAEEHPKPEAPPRLTDARPTPVRAGPFKVLPLLPGRWQVIDKRRPMGKRSVAVEAFLRDANDACRRLGAAEGHAVQLTPEAP